MFIFTTQTLIFLRNVYSVAQIDLTIMVYMNKFNSKADVIKQQKSIRTDLTSPRSTYKPTLSERRTYFAFFMTEMGVNLTTGNCNNFNLAFQERQAS